MNELYWPANSWSAGNEDLEPERLTTAEAGAEAGDDRRSAGVTAYWTEARELIVWTESAHVWRPENVGSASLRGIELDAEARLGALEIAYAADFGRATDSGSELELPYRPRVVQTLSAGALFGRLSGELRARTSDAFFVDEANTGRLDGYTVLDGAASWRLPLPDTELTLEVWNVLDEEYALRNGYAMPGRQWRAGIVLGAGAQLR
jgi:outer membrane cobalamin receptor